MSRRPGGQDGGALAVLSVSLAALALVGLILVELGQLLRAYTAAAGSADAAALAAAAATAPDDPEAPEAAAGRIAAAGGARLRGCACTTPVVEVTVVRPADTLLLDRLGISEVAATARATLVPDPAG